MANAGLMAMTAAGLDEMGQIHARTERVRPASHRDCVVPYDAHDSYKRGGGDLRKVWLREKVEFRWQEIPSAAAG